MLKILYAASNRPSSFYSLKRFIDTYGKYYNIKTAAYSKSIRDIDVDWNLDALLDFRGKYFALSTKNSNFALYVREIKKFSPHLIISDMELYTSYIGLEIGLPVWQVSPILLYYGIENKNNIYKYYSGIFSRDMDKNQYTNYILNNSDKKLVLSHLGDLKNPPELRPGYDWVRPNYNLLKTNNKTIRLPSTAIHLADAYFSGQKTMLDIDYSDHEAIITSQLNYENNLSTNSQQDAIEFDVTLNNNIRFLSQFLKEADI